MAITEVENRKFAELLATLSADDWATPTDCPRWDVRAMAAHLVGSAASQVSPREFARQVRKGRPIVAEIGGEAWWDGMNEVQVRERANLSTTEIMAVTACRCDPSSIQPEPSHPAARHRA